MCDSCGTEMWVRASQRDAQSNFCEDCEDVGFGDVDDSDAYAAVDDDWNPNEP